MLRAEAPKPKLVPFSVWFSRWVAFWDLLAATIVRTYCRACSRFYDRHPPCAVCESTNQHMKLCPVCRRSPFNKGWRDSRERVQSEDDLAADERTLRPERLADRAGAKPIKDEKPHVQEILRMLRTGASFRVVAVAVGRSVGLVEYIYRTRVRQLPRRAKR